MCTKNQGLLRIYKENAGKFHKSKRTKNGAIVLTAPFDIVMYSISSYE